MLVKTSTLIGKPLDWAVLKCVGWFERNGSPHNEPLYLELCGYSPSTDWSRGGPIIEEDRIELRHDGRKSWCAWAEKTGAVHGPTPLIAAMRCKVASVYGDEVEIPDELMESY